MVVADLMGNTSEARDVITVHLYERVIRATYLSRRHELAYASAVPQAMYEGAKRPTSRRTRAEPYPEGIGFVFSERSDVMSWPRAKRGAVERPIVLP